MNNNDNNQHHRHSNHYSLTQFAFVALLPCVLMLFGASEKSMFVTVLIGISLSYCADLTCKHNPEITIAIIWVTIVACYLAMLIESDLFFFGNRPTIVSMFLILMNGILLFLCGLFATIQFKVLDSYENGKNVREWMERVLASSILPVCGSLIGWMFMASVGAVQAPFYLQCVLVVMFHAADADDDDDEDAIDNKRNQIVNIRNNNMKNMKNMKNTDERTSSAPGSGRISSLLTNRERKIHQFCVLLCPAAVYIGTHWPTLYESIFEHALNVTILISLGATVLFKAKKKMLLLVTFVAVGFRVVDTTEYSVLLLLGGAVVLLILSLIDVSRLNVGIYALFMCFAIATIGYFLKRNFWFIEGMENTCLGILLITSITFAVPGLYLMDCSQETIFIMLLVQVIILAQVEAMLYNEIQEDGSTFYPPYLVALTTFCGIQLSKMLNLGTPFGTKNKFPESLIYMVYISKLSIFLDLEWLKIFVLMCVSASQYTAFIVLGLLYARFELFDALFLLSGHRPTDAGLFGSLLCATSVLGGFRSFRKARLIIMISGLMLILLHPPLPWQGEVGFWYDKDHVPDREPDDMFIYGSASDSDSDSSSVAYYKNWFLILSVTFGLFGSGGLSGATFGFYLSLVYTLPFIICASCALCGSFVQTRNVYIFYAFIAVTLLVGLVLKMFIENLADGGMDDDENNATAVENFLSVVSVCLLHCAVAVKFDSDRTSITREENGDDDRVYNPFVKKRTTKLKNDNSLKKVETSLNASLLLTFVCNFSTILAFLSTLYIFWDDEDSSLLTIPSVSMILMLLEGTHERRLFWTYIAITFGYLLQAVLGLSANTFLVFFYALFSFPCCYFYVFFLYSNKQRSTETWALSLATPLNIIPIIIGYGFKMNGVLGLGLVSLVSGIANAYFQNRIRIRGLKFL